MAIDIFSKFCIILVLRDRLSTTLVRWFYTTILYEYRYPWFIYIDRGNEFTKHFGELAQKNCITHHVASVAYPPSNGQVEIFNRMIKQSLCITAFLGDSIHDVRLVFIIVVSWVYGYTLFEVVYKQLCFLLWHLWLHYCKVYNTLMTNTIVG